MSILSMFKGIRLPTPPSPSPPRVLEPPDRVILPLRQHQGGVCDPVVSPGDQVGLGQLVGTSEDFETADVHSSVSGTVEALTETLDPAGQPVKAVVIKNDGRDAPPEGSGERQVLQDPELILKTRPTRLLKRLRSAGLVRAATLGLPLHVDLSPPMAPRSYLYMTGIPVVRPVDTLVIKAVDPDPPVTPNQAALAAEDSGRYLELGVLALARIAGTKRVIIAAAKGQVPAWLTELTAAREWELTQVDGSHFPFALDNLLVHSLTGREVPTPYGEPRDVGVVMEPLVTALDVGRVLMEGGPMLERVFTVAGEVAGAQTFKVRLGTPLAKVLEAAGVSGNLGKVILGGPMMGYAQFDLNTPVTKETDGAFVQSSAKLAHFQNEPCIHCGRCVQVCPVNLVPAELGKLCEYGQFETAAERDLMHCIECGCCAYVCPAKRPMVHLLRYGKSEVMAGRMEQ